MLVQFIWQGAVDFLVLQTITSCIPASAGRVYEHKNKRVKGFTQKYNVDRLVYYEAYKNIVVAIERKKQIKVLSGKKKTT